jgi:hypothetical protein
VLWALQIDITLIVVVNVIAIPTGCRCVWYTLWPTPVLAEQFVVGASALLHPSAQQRPLLRPALCTHAVFRQQYVSCFQSSSVVVFRTYAQRTVGVYSTERRQVSSRDVNEGQRSSLQVRVSAPTGISRSGADNLPACVFYP